MKSEIIRQNGVTALLINGKPYSFAATRSFRPEGRIFRDFSDHGIQFYNIFPSGIMTALNKRTIPYSQFGPIWVGDHTYNWDNLRAQCDEFFPNLAPDTYVSLSVHLDPPDWYVKSTLVWWITGSRCSRISAPKNGGGMRRTTCAPSSTRWTNGTPSGCTPSI